jgi:hypothetical protein
LEWEKPAVTVWSARSGRIICIFFSVYPWRSSSTSLYVGFILFLPMDERSVGRTTAKAFYLADMSVSSFLVGGSGEDAGGEV